MNVTLCDYKNIKIELESPAPSVTIDEVEAQKKLIAEQFTEPVEIDGPLQNGHTSIIDFVGSVDGVEFDGGKAENYELVIGSGMFIPGFESQMVGMEKGEVRVVKVRFPDQYTPELAGKDAQFKVTLHAIKVKPPVELNDEVLKKFAEAQGLNEIDTIEKLDKFLWNNIYTKKLNDMEKEIHGKIEKFLLDSCTVEIPADLLDAQTEAQIKGLEDYAKSSGMDLATMALMMGQDEAGFKDYVAGMVKAELSINAILDEIARAENLLADNNDVAEFYESTSKANNVPIEVLKEKYSEESVKTYVNGFKAFRLLRGIAQISYKS